MAAESPGEERRGLRPPARTAADAPAPAPVPPPPPPAPPAPPAPTWRDRAGPVLAPVLVVAAAKVAMLALAFVMMQQPDQFAHRLATRWDGEHYLRIAHEGFQRNGVGKGDSVAFGMLYPGAIALLGGSEAAALAVANVCSLAAVALLAWHRGPRPALAVGLFPSFLVYGTVAYSEGLYILLAAATFVLLDRGRLWWAGAAGALAAATRYSVGPALLLAALPWGRWREPRRWATFVLVAGAGAALAVFQWMWTGDALAYFDQQKFWGARFAWPWEHFDFLLNGWFTHQGGPIADWGNLSPIDFVTRDVLFVTPAVAGVVLLWRTAGARAAAVYSAVALAIAVCTIGTPGASLPRLMLAAFPALAAVGERMRGPLLWSCVLVVAVALAAHGLVHHLFAFWS